MRVLVLLLLCSSFASAKVLQPVSLQLKWKYQFQFAGYIMAKEKGFYNDVGLDVTIKEWDYGINMVDELLSFKSDYTLTSPSSLIDISNGKKIVYLATIFQSSPLILLADKSSGIRSVKDFKHKRMMTTGDLNSDTSLLSMMFSQGIKMEDMKIKKPSFNTKDLLNGKADLMAAYISNEPHQLEKMGGTPVIFSPKDYGFDFYGDILVTTKEHLECNPQEVKNFRSATLEGWEYAFSHMQETVDIIYNKYNTQHRTKEALMYEAKELKKLAYFKTDTLGKIEKEKLRKIYDVYKLLGLLRHDVNLDEVIYNEHLLKKRFTELEKDYLRNRKNITMCIDPNWMPFEQFDHNGNYEGMTADYYKLFEKILGTKFKVIPTKTWTESIEFAKERKCDIFSLAMETPERKKYMNFTTPYLKIPLVVATSLDVPFINEIKDLQGKKVGISKGYAFVELLRNKYPNLNIVEVEDIDDGLDKVNSGELFGYIGTLASVGYKFQTKYSGELKIAGKIADNWKLGIGVRNDDPMLLRVLEKAVLNISKEQHRDILNHWVSIKYEKGVDYSVLWKTIGVFTLIVLVGLYFMRKQNKLKENLKEANEKLELAYTQLERLAVTDKLTQLYNRHKLDKVLEQEKNRSDRYGDTFGVMIVDIDLFKNINDTYGHQIGDTVLQELAEIFKENSRESDTVGRWGGEEFLIIAPQVNEDSMTNFAQNLKDKVQHHLFAEKYKITISIGMTIYKAPESIDAVITRADEALYFSKENGRNQVTFIS